MKIAVYSLTRDRLEYTKVCFESLHKNAGVSFDHFVLDNGSQDGTDKWLRGEYANQAKKIFYEFGNRGISKGSNILLDYLLSYSSYDLICKIDNDCLVKSENILGQIVEIYESLNFHARYILSPNEHGIVKQPTRGRYTQLAGRKIGLTAIVGGLFHCVPVDIYKQYRYPDDYALAKGQDDHFCNWVKANGAEVGYIEDLVVEHYETTDGQAKRYPEYFERKYKEELQIANA